MTLKKIYDNTNTMGDINPLHFSDINPNTISEGYVFVKFAMHRFTRYEKPYIALYMQDIDGLVIPGYIWDIVDIEKSGIDINRVERNLVKIKCRDNYIPNRGLTVTIDTIHLIENPPINILNIFTDSSKEVEKAGEELKFGLSERLKITVNIPFTWNTLSDLDYDNGRLGGVVIHYRDMFKSLDVFANMYSKEEQEYLWGTFLLFMQAHSNYLVAKQNGSIDVILIDKIMTAVREFCKVIKTSAGAIEVVHSLIGYIPKDVFVRLILSVSDLVMKATKEHNLYKTLPLEREGDCGYGVVKKYKQTEIK